jgi:mRNA-degrading endonuclease RelE of RelBE toxin-antitoxin system
LAGLVLAHWLTTDVQASSKIHLEDKENVMPSIEQLQQDIQSLPEEAQVLLADFIEILKKRYPPPSSATTISEGSTYQRFRESGFIGGVAIEENLSETYKQVLVEKWSTKHDHG